FVRGERASGRARRVDLLRIALAEKNGRSRIAAQQGAGDGGQNRLAILREAPRDFLARLLHSLDERRVAKLDDPAPEVAFRKLLRRVVLAEQQPMFQRREERDAEVVSIDELLEAARRVVVIDEIAIRLDDIGVDAFDKAHDLRRIPVRQSDEADL